MKIGLETISWGLMVEDMKGLIEGVSRLKYEGLEFAQNTRTLGDPVKLRQFFELYHIKPVGLVGGLIPEQMEYAKKLDVDYLCLDEWDHEGIKRVIDYGLKVGLHPHRYKTTEKISKVEPYLARYPEVGLILDIAHLYLAGENIMDVLEKYYNRLFSVHFKDWNSRFGLSPYRFARGFCALGEGELNDPPILKEVFIYLEKSNYQGWIIVEQDFPNGDPFNCAKVSRDWLYYQEREFGELLHGTISGNE